MDDRVEALSRLANAQHELIGLLLDEQSDMIESGFVHGWVSKRSKQVNDVRDKIDLLKKAMRRRK